MAETTTGTTRAAEVPQSTGTAYHVAPSGSDAAEGTETAPFATIAHALSVALAGDAVLVHAGTYHESVQPPRGGDSSAPITLQAAGDGPAIMDGADPSLKDAGAWSSSGGGVYSAAAAATRSAPSPSPRLSLGQPTSCEISPTTCRTSRPTPTG
jgi:hypothetical protein